MGRARATVKVSGLISEAEAVWYDTDRWPAFVDGLDHVVHVQDGWPVKGGYVLWESHPGGRGAVAERVVAFEPRRGQETLVEDEESRATQRIAFTAQDGGVVVTLELDYQIKSRSPLTPIVDVLFVRRAQNESLRRTLAQFARQVALDAAARAGEQPASAPD